MDDQIPKPSERYTVKHVVHPVLLGVPVFLDFILSEYFGIRPFQIAPAIGVLYYVATFAPSMRRLPAYSSAFIVVGTLFWTIYLICLVPDPSSEVQHLVQASGIAFLQKISPQTMNLIAGALVFFGLWASAVLLRAVLLKIWDSMTQR